MKSVEEQLALIKRGTEEVLVEAELVEKLKRGLCCGSRRVSTLLRQICILAIPFLLISCVSSRSSAIRWSS